MTQHVPSFKPYDSYTQETTKVAELKDQFGKTRFKIALTDYDDNEYPYNDDLQTFDTYFQVTVVSYCYGDALDNPVTLVEEVFTSIDPALKRFYELVSQYRHLINVETKGWQDISIYAEKIGYHKVDPDRCRNCRWAKPVTPKVCPPEELRKHKGRFVCMNPVLAKDVSDFEKEDPHNRDNYYTYSETRSHFKFDLAPYTQEDGHCKYYVNGRHIHFPQPKHKTQFAADPKPHCPYPCPPCPKPESFPIPTDLELQKLIDIRNRDECIIKYEVNKQMTTAISTTVIPAVLPAVLPEVGKAIEYQLSSNPPIIDGNRMINDRNGNGTLDPNEESYVAVDGGGA